MRLLLDLIGAQTDGSRVRGIGRYTRELALALARHCDERIDLRFALSANYPEPAAELAAALSAHVAPSAISSYATPVQPAISQPQASPARRLGEAIVRRHVAGVRPDMLLASSLYEVAEKDFAYFDLRRQPAGLTSCIVYDFIPLIYRNTYLKYPGYRRFYQEQTAVVASADLLFAISECTRRDAIEYLRIAPERIVNIAGAADACFAPRTLSPAEAAERLARLRVREPFIFCVAGTDPRKNAGAAVDAFLSMSEADRAGAQLVMLVPFSDDQKRPFLQRAKRAGLGADDMMFLDRIGDDDLAFLYAQAELFLFPSLYEGFGLPLLEAMQCGGAVIAGNNSSLREIANRPDVLCDTSSPKAIAAKLAQGLRDADWRRDVRAWGVRRAAEFSWRAAARALQDAALERAPGLGAARSRREPAAFLRVAENFEAEAALLTAGPKRAATPEAAAELILQSAPFLYDGSVRRLLVDVSDIVEQDLRTGIQRVVRNVVRSLYCEADGSAITPIAVRRVGDALWSAQAFVAGLVGAEATVPDAALDIQPGDHLLMIDSSWNEFSKFAPIFAQVREGGGLVVTCIYDLIPELYRAASVDPVPRVYGAWLRAALTHCDGVLAISETVANELRDFVARARLPHRPGLRIGWFHCGSELDAVAGARAAPRPTVARAFQGGGPVFIMVGTIEPRKGHQIALEALDRLWARGSGAKLVFFGKKGWYVESLLDRVARHPAYGSKLFWFSDANDDELAFAYQSCTAVLCPSYAEGFGLPLAEATLAGAPALCSDIPVFREIGRDGALYFRVNDPAALAAAIDDFLGGRARPDPAGVLRTTWAQAASRIMDVIMGERWSWTLPGHCGAPPEPAAAEDEAPVARFATEGK